MAGFIYLPVVTDEMKGFAKDLNDGRQERKKPPYPILYNRSASGFVLPGQGCLKQVMAGKLYVIAHGGDLGSKFIGATVHNTKASFSPFDLARTLLAEELPTSFIDLRVFACGSALPTADGQAYAERLKREMSDLGYKFIQVTGYQGSLRSAYVTVKKNLIEFHNETHKSAQYQGEMRRAKDLKKIF